MNIVDRFKKGDIVINCNTAAQANALFDWCTKNGIKVTEQTKAYSFFDYEKTTCYRCVCDYNCELCYADFDYYKEEGYTIIRYLDFFEENTNTIKIKDIVEKYAEYEIDEDKLKELLIEPKPKTIWELKVRDIYFYINSDGAIVSSIWVSDIYHKNRRAAGNCFLTREEAEFELERRKVETELLKYGGTRDMMSLGGSEIPKHCICYNHVTGRLTTNWYGICNLQGLILFETEELAKKAMEEIGEERLKKYIFNVEE